MDDLLRGNLHQVGDLQGRGVPSHGHFECFCLLGIAFHPWKFAEVRLVLFKVSPQFFLVIHPQKKVLEVWAGEAGVNGQCCAIKAGRLHHHAVVHQGIGQPKVLDGLALVELLNAREQANSLTGSPFAQYFDSKAELKVDGGNFRCFPDDFSCLSCFSLVVEKLGQFFARLPIIGILSDQIEEMRFG